MDRDKDWKDLVSHSHDSEPAWYQHEPSANIGIMNNNSVSSRDGGGRGWGSTTTGWRGIGWRRTGYGNGSDNDSANSTSNTNSNCNQGCSQQKIGAG